MASFFEWPVVQSDKWGQSNISSLSNAEEFDSMTLEAYCQKYLPGMRGWLASKMTECLLGVNASEPYPQRFLLMVIATKNESCDGLVGVYNVGGTDSWYGCDLNVSACVSN